LGPFTFERGAEVNNMSKEIFSKEPQEFNLVLAAALKNIPEFEPPEWSFFVKSGVSRERPADDEDFWYKRAASILRQLYLNGVVGVQRLRTRYGGKKNRGGKPEQFRRASGKIIRVILQQAERAGLVEKVDKLQFGRRLTQKGRDFLDSIEVKGSGKGLIIEKVEPKKVEDIQEDFDEAPEVAESNEDKVNEEQEDGKETQ
jgi:small subunit ribosomal protein S19e